MQIGRSMLAFCAFFLLLGGASSAQATTQGFRECTELCYVQECGEMGVRCPTETQKRMYRTMCRGRCKEKVRRQRVEEMLRIERERAARYRQLIILRHNLWLQKKQTVAHLRMQYLAAKQRNQVAVATAHYRKMIVAFQEQLGIMHQKLQMKEKFYEARQTYRVKQRADLLDQVKRLKNELALARQSSQKDKERELQAQLKTKQREEIKVYKNATKLKVEFFKTRIQRRKHEIKQIKAKRDELQQAKLDAKKQHDQRKLEELARQLGELAGRQAAITQKTDLEQIKLRQAHLAYIAASRRDL